MKSSVCKSEACPSASCCSVCYECGQATLLPGDLLLIFTDGLVEAEDDKEEEYGESRMLATLNLHSDRTAADVLQILMASADRFVGSAPQHDDITCLVLRTVPSCSGANLKSK
ncbi:MAG: PP2C family protein-serine/threonine phosphatase [Bryobacteraceae bacterium]